MQTGKVPGNILYRSVTNLIGRGPVAARDCADLGKSDGRVIASTQTGTMGNDISLRMAVYKAANNIWSAGGRLVGIQAAFLLRENAEEQELKAMISSGRAGIVIPYLRADIPRCVKDFHITW